MRISSGVSVSVRDDTTALLVGIGLMPVGDCGAAPHPVIRTDAHKTAANADAGRWRYDRGADLGVALVSARFKAKPYVCFPKNFGDGNDFGYVTVN
jgi:hypothetical protein